MEENFYLEPEICFDYLLFVLNCVKAIHRLTHTYSATVLLCIIGKLRQGNMLISSADNQTWGDGVHEAMKKASCRERKRKR